MNTKKSEYESHRKRHKLLHSHLDELVADFIIHTTNKYPSKSTILELMEWSMAETLNPTGEIKNE